MLRKEVQEENEQPALVKSDVCETGREQRNISMELKQLMRKVFENSDKKSLCYEEDRLATFIDWPVKFISEKDLAAEGFYYLRTKGYCACAFCHSLVGTWKEGDTPHGNHKQVNGYCRFVRGKPTPNVPLNQDRIIVKPEDRDIYGTGREGWYQRSTPGPVTVESPKGSADIYLKDFGLKEHRGPKHMDYLTLDARLQSFKHWPERVKQRPEEMAEAGFYYFGLSDLVRCFHCAIKLRNWEDDDKPWVEHARWYPDCHFVLLQKGIDFIDKVRRERPPYLPFHNSKESVSTSCGASSSSDTLTEEDFEQLMDQRIMKEVLSMGFAKNVIMTALSRKLKQTSVPFFTLEAAVEAILAVMDEETKRTIREEITSQARKMTSIEESVRNTNSSSENESSSSTYPHSESERVVESSQSSTKTAAESLQQSGRETVEERIVFSEYPPLPNNNRRISEGEEPIIATQNIVSSASLYTESSDSYRAEEPIIATQNSEQEINSFTLPLLNDADITIKEADRLLRPPQVSCSNSHEDLGCEKDTEMESLTNSLEDEKEAEGKSTVDAANLEMESEKLKETHTCRVCMDREMDIVFLPCTHMVACSSCAAALSSCPICRTVIQYAFKPIIS